MKLSDLKPGMTVYDCHSYRMGNTCMRSLGVWRVLVIDVHENHAVVSWNGNTPTRYFARQIKRLVKNEPYLVGISTGQYRRETVAERKARLANTSIEPQVERRTADSRRSGGGEGEG